MRTIKVQELLGILKHTETAAFEAYLASPIYIKPKGSAVV